MATREENVRRMQDAQRRKGYDRAAMMPPPLVRPAFDPDMGNAPLPAVSEYRNLPNALDRAVIVAREKFNSAPRIPLPGMYDPRAQAQNIFQTGDDIRATERAVGKTLSEIGPDDVYRETGLLPIRGAQFLLGGQAAEIFTPFPSMIRDATNAPGSSNRDVQEGDLAWILGKDADAADAYLRASGKRLTTVGQIAGLAPFGLAGRAERAGEGVLEAANAVRKAEVAPSLPAPREIEIPTDFVYRNLAALGDYGTAPPKPAISNLPLPFKLGEVPQGTPMRGAQPPVSMGQGSIAPPPYADPARIPVTEEAFLRARQRANDAARTARAAEERGAPYAGAISNNAARAQDDFAQVERIARGEPGEIPPGILPPQGPRPAPYVAPMVAGGPDVPLGGTRARSSGIPGLTFSTSLPDVKTGIQSVISAENRSPSSVLGAIPEAPSTPGMQGVFSDIRGLLRGREGEAPPIANDVPMGTTPVPSDIGAAARQTAIQDRQGRIRDAERMLQSPGLTQQSRDVIQRQISRYVDEVEALQSGKDLPPAMPTPRATSTTTPINPNRLNSVIPPLALGAGIGGAAALDAADSEEGINPITLAPAIMIGLIGARNLAKAGQTSRLVAYEEAGRMAAQGASREDIFAKTGWFKGNDQKWRTEIDDSTSTLADDVDDVFSKRAPVPVVLDKRLDETFHHPELYRAYPGLGKTNTSFMQADQLGEGAGSFNPNTNKLTAIAPNSEKARGMILHEAQHGVQNVEGFSPGTSVQRVVGERLDEIDARMRDLDVELRQARFLGSMANNPQTRAQAAARVTELEAERQALTGKRADLNSPDAGLKGFLTAAGEVEARNATARMDMTAPERRATPPWVTQSVRDDQQIVYPPDAPRLARSMGDEGPPFTPFNAFLQDDLSNPGRYPVPDDVQKGLERAVTPLPPKPVAPQNPPQFTIVAQNNPDVVARFAPTGDAQKDLTRAFILADLNGLSFSKIPGAIRAWHGALVSEEELRKAGGKVIAALRDFRNVPPNDIPQAAVRLASDLGVTPVELNQFAQVLMGKFQKWGKSFDDFIATLDPSLVSTGKAPGMALPGRVQQVRELAREGALDSEIADELGMDVEEVLAIRQRHGIERKFIGSNRNDWDYDPRD